MSESGKTVKSAQNKPWRWTHLIAILVLFALILGGIVIYAYWNWVGLVAKSMQQLEQGDLAASRATAKDAISYMAPAQRISPDSMATSIRLLMNIYACRRHFTEAQIVNRRLLDFDKSIWGENSFQYADEICGLALMKRKLREFDESARLYKFAISIYDRFPEKAAEKARVQGLLCWDLIQTGKLDEAETMLKEADSFLKEKFGTNSFERLVPLIELAYLHKIKKDSVYKEELAAEYKMVTEPKRLEKSSAQTVVVLNLMAQLFAEEKQNEEALASFQIAEKNCESSVFGRRSNLYMADILQPESELLTVLGRKKEAANKLEEARHIRQLRFGEDESNLESN